MFRFSHFFIDRPIFATVLSVLLTIAGFIAQRALPISEYPEIAPPTVNITAAYPGASAEVIASTVASLSRIPVPFRKTAIPSARVTTLSSSIGVKPCQSDKV